jgi:Ni,Fe-hydrogenase III component G
MGLPNQVPLQVGLDWFQKNFPQKKTPKEKSLPKSQVQTEVQAEVLPKVLEVLLEKIRQEKIQKVLLDRPMVSQVGVQVGLPNQVLIPMMPTPTLNR